MASSVKLTDIVKGFEGTATGEFSAWLKKFELACKLKSVKSNLESILPMFLEGSAFAVYDQLPEDVTGDYEKLKQALLAAFCEDKFSAYRLLRSGGYWKVSL